MYLLYSKPDACAFSARNKGVAVIIGDENCIKPSAMTRFYTLDLVVDTRPCDVVSLHDRLADVIKSIDLRQLDASYEEKPRTFLEGLRKYKRVSH